MKLALVMAAACVLGGCGYRVGGKANLIPSNIRTIAIPPFASYTTDYQLADSLPNAIAHEFITRGRFEVVKDRQSADAELTGTITRVIRGPALSDPNTGRTTSGQLNVIMDLRLVERSTGKVLFERKGYSAKSNYEIAGDPHLIFDESSTAVMRLEAYMARDIVSSILEDF